MSDTELDPDIEPVHISYPDPFKNDPRLTLSPSAMSSYEICGARGAYYQDRSIPRTSSMTSARGRAWHKAMEAYGLAQQGGWASSIPVSEWERELKQVARGEMHLIITGSDFVATPDDDLMGTLIQLDTMIDSFFAASPSQRWNEQGIEVEAIERTVAADLGSPTHFLVGVMDRVVKVGHQLIGIDYKSAGRAWGGRKADGDPRLSVQGPLYAEGWEQTFGGAMDWVAFDVTTVKGKFQRVWVPTHREVRQPILDRWLTLSESITLHTEAGKPMPTNPGHFLCSEKWCSYWDRCPMGAEYSNLLATPPVTANGLTIASTA